MQEIKALRSFSLTSLPRGKRERGRWKEKSGVRGNKVTWLEYYIQSTLVPKNSTVRCHGYGQEHQQIPSWILPDGCSIWNPLAWRYPLQRERWRGFWRDVGVDLSSPGLRLRGNKWLERWRTPKRKLFHRLPEVEDREKGREGERLKTTTASMP